MLIVGEKIHILNPVVHDALESGDITPIVELAVRQSEAGAHALDLNLGPGRAAGKMLPDIIKAIQDRVETTFLFPADTVEFTRAIKSCRKRVIINAVTADPDRLERALAAADCFDAEVVVLLTRQGELPASVDQWCLMAEDVLELAEKKGFSTDRLYLDPVLRTRLDPGVPGLGTSAMEMGPVLQTISLLSQLREEGPKTMAGLSNISLHLPAGKRSPLHCSVLELLKAAGLSAVILNPLDPSLMSVAGSAPLSGILAESPAETDRRQIHA